MSTIIKLFASVLLFVTIFTALLYHQNGITIEVAMKSTPNTTLDPKLYFKGANEHFSEHNARQSLGSQNGIYRFAVPNINVIESIRFDPTTRAFEMIEISSIRIVRRNWFKSLYYTLPLATLSPKHHINTFQASPNKVTFSTQKGDPQLLIDFQVQKVGKSYHLPLIPLLTSLILTTLLLYLLLLAKSNSEQQRAKIILYSLFLAFITFKSLYYKEHIRFSYPPDETMHLKYIQYTQEHMEIVPKFEDMPHYLSHPPLYYKFLSLITNDHLSTKENINHYRTLSMLLFLLALLLILYLGFSAQLSLLGDFVYLTLITAIPMHSYIGASISNDTLGMLGAIVAIIGLKRIIEQNYHTLSYFLLAFGGFLAYFSKLTSALLLFFALLLFVVYMIFTKKWIKITKKDLLLIALFLAPVLYYQASIMLNYHALVPTYNHTHPEAYLTSNFFVPEAHRLNLSPYQWFERMLHYIHGGWFGIHSHHSFGHPTWFGVFGLVALHLLAILALVLPSKQKQQHFSLIGKITLLSLFGVLGVQYLFSYQTHINAGYLGGLQPRYLLPFMFAFAIMASLFVERFRGYFLFQITIIALCIHALYGDFFYFLQYYQ
jgi:hypothetical protein